MKVNEPCYQVGTVLISILGQVNVGCSIIIIIIIIVIIKRTVDIADAMVPHQKHYVHDT